MSDDLPGVELRMKSSQLKKNTASGKKRVELTMEAEIADDEIWNAVELKLKSGLKIYSVEDFHTELRNALIRENKELQAKNRELSGRTGQLEIENRQMKAALSVLDRSLSSG